MSADNTIGINPEDQFISVRVLIDTLFEQDPISVAEMEGITLVQRSEERPAHEDCYGFVFGEDFEAELARVAIDGEKSDHVEGAIAFYFDEGFLVHVGIATADGNIISKWGEGPVFKHRPHLVPTYYGKIGGYKIDQQKTPGK